MTIAADLINATLPADELTAPPLYELCFFVGSYYDDSYTEAKNSGAIYKSGFKLLKSELAANKEKLQLLQRIADTTEQAINSKQTNVIAVLVNCNDSEDMLHLHEHI